MVEGGSEGGSAAGAMEGGVGEVREVSGGGVVPASTAPVVVAAAADLGAVGGHHHSSGDDSADDEAGCCWRVDEARIRPTLLEMWERGVGDWELACNSIRIFRQVWRQRLASFWCESIPPAPSPHPWALILCFWCSQRKGFESTRSVVQQSYFRREIFPLYSSSTDGGIRPELVPRLGIVSFNPRESKDKTPDGATRGARL